MDIASNIRFFLSTTGVKQMQLSVKTGLSQSFISQLCNGSKTPNILALSKICDALGITMSEFFAVNDTAPDRHTIDTPKVGDYLASIRKKAGLTQARVASLAGVSQSTLSDAENNERELSLTSFISICKALSVSPAKTLSVVTGEGLNGINPLGSFMNGSLTDHEMSLLTSLIALLPSQQAVK